MPQRESDYQHDELWKDKKGREITIERLSKDWATGKYTVQFWHEQKAYTMDMEEFEKEFTHVEESRDYIIKYAISGKKEEFDTPQEAAKFLLKYCDTGDVAIEECIYAGEKNYRIGSMYSLYFWNPWEHGEDVLDEIATGKIPKECATSYTKYSKAIMEGTKFG